jgi:hypothetical protein
VHWLSFGRSEREWRPLRGEGWAASGFSSEKALRIKKLKRTLTQSVPALGHLR